MNPSTPLEPALRDPRKLRNTAWILVLIMLLGGSFIYIAYAKWAAGQNEDTRPNFVYQIRKERDLRVMRQDGRTVDLFDPRGSVWVVNVISITQPETSRRSMDVMKKIAADHSGREDLIFVSLVVDSPQPEQLLTSLTNHAETLDMQLPQWWLCATEPKTTHKFIKNQLKADTFPHQEEGRWVFDTSLVVIDRGGHIRRAVVPNRRGGAPYIATFDFDQAAEWDDEGKQTGIELSNVEQLETLLRQTIETLIHEPPLTR
ncbi:MAG: hypothetical protein ACO3RV_01795 [Luteolibacter sp.]